MYLSKLQMNFSQIAATRPEQSEHVRHRGVRGGRQNVALPQDGADTVAKVNRLIQIQIVQKRTK